MREIYEGWTIVTKRGSYTDLIKRTFKYGKFQWLCADISLSQSKNKYYLTLCGSSPFKFDEDIPLRSKDYHSLCNEGNDTLRGLFTEAHKYLLQFIKELPDI